MVPYQERAERILLKTCIVANGPAYSNTIIYCLSSQQKVDTCYFYSIIVFELCCEHVLVIPR